ncbi:hypothetical protein J2T12_001298 [Paenibacillus anaericanus]|uniref:hypothetical protein n=1 Tax=Paenibacillus anaericanus TaxID=170367 RepID=UPI002782C2BB|nr:hypothetical protein [Paenibacillus anaericanus]MDQ0087892.1 hypothetical protein [Paenibacillus anaericanus]
MKNIIQKIYPVLLNVFSKFLLLLLSISLFNFKVHSLTILFIIPVGSLALGGTCCVRLLPLGYENGEKASKKYYPFGVILALITMIGIEYGEYMI